MTAEIPIMGLFTDDAKRPRPSWTRARGVQLPPRPSPIPSHKIMEALQRRKPGGLVHPGRGHSRFFSGFALAIFSATRWDLIAGGKPVIS
jgi:molybdopterin-containing oxidoreductase family membrane subunit